VEKGTLTESAFRQMNDILHDASTEFILTPLDAEIAMAVERIPRNIVPEMPDRIIAATALYLNLPLVTRDAKIQAAPIVTIW
jgi:predicted nucleic acid-binding protein